MPDMRDLLVAEMDRQKMTDNDLRAGLMAIAGGESELRPVSEVSYAGTSNDRIRGIFKTAMRGKSDAFISDLKRDPERFFNYVYGPEGTGDALGNTQAGDGYRYRGRGVLQLTGRDNYARYAAATGYDLVSNPDLANDPAAAVAIAVAYMLDRYDGGGWDAMKRAVGNSFGTVDARKNALYQQYRTSGEFDYRPGEASSHPDTRSGTPTPSQVVGGDREEKRERLKEIQIVLKEAGYYVLHSETGKPLAIDGIFGEESRRAMSQLLADAGQRRL